MLMLDVEVVVVYAVVVGAVVVKVKVVVVEAVMVDAMPLPAAHTASDTYCLCSPVRLHRDLILFVGTNLFYARNMHMIVRTYVKDSL